MTAPFLFSTGIENSYPTIAGGKRIDEMEKCGHYSRFREDFALTKEMGIRYLRWGPPLHKTFVGPGQYDWEWTDAAMGEMQRLGIEPILDLCHFGVPDWLGNFQNPDLPRYFAEYADVCAARYPWVRYWTPVNEILVAALFSGWLGNWNECLRGHTPFLTALRNMCMMNVLAMDAISVHSEDPTFIQSESSEYWHPAHPNMIEAARFWNRLRFLPLDLTYGHDIRVSLYDHLLANGFTRADYELFMNRKQPARCIMGNDYYQWNEHLMVRTDEWVPSGEILGYYVITKQYYDRYQLPVMHTETNAVTEQAVTWLWKEWSSMIRLRDDRIPVVGFTWYSLTDQIDWDSGLTREDGHVYKVGLYDLDRKLRPVGRAYQRLIQEWAGVIDQSAEPLEKQGHE
jgi:beta-glucosidase/6-phospho-beta-glucosidase/beta-galactosidase